MEENYMKNVKKFILPGLSAALMLTAVILVACSTVNTSFNIGMHVEEVYKGIIWGTKEVEVTAIQGGGVHSFGPLDSAILPLLGWIFVLIGMLGLVAVTFFGDKLFKSDKMVKGVAIACGVLVIVGGIFQFFAIDSFAESAARFQHLSVDNVKEQLKAANATAPLCTAGGILAIIGGVVGVVPAFLPEK